MSDLKVKSCLPCRSDSPPATAAEISAWMPQLPHWQIDNSHAGPRLTRSFKFKNFRQALAFSNRVGELAETEQHHPAILTEWGLVTVSWWTHKINALHANDFIMAAKTDQLVASD